MNFGLNQSGKSLARRAGAAFTLIEVLTAIAVLVTVLAGLIYGYVQANWTAEWSSMSLAAQSFASQGAEVARAANWSPHDIYTNGVQDADQWPNGVSTNFISFMDIPTRGDPSAINFQFWVTNHVSVTDVSVNPPLRQIRSDCTWTFPMNGRLCTNTVILVRAGDQ
jgi:type II secretory pathway pseudopilin PulG